MKKVYLLILDGFACGKHDTGDAIFAAKKPFLDSLFARYPISHLQTHGRSVGLPEFQTGGSEAGHITIGAGRPIRQFLTQISDQMDSGAFLQNSALEKVFRHAKKAGRIHFFGMISDGGIHSFLPHVFGLGEMAKKYGISPENVFLHAITDGRDVGLRTAGKFLDEIERRNFCRLATIGGRFFAMDRDQNWDRIEPHFRAMTDPDFEHCAKNVQNYLADFYAHSDESDYYLPPALFLPEAQIRADDAVIFFNFRSDRMRQISAAFFDSGFQKFSRKTILNPENVAVFGKFCDGVPPAFAADSSSAKNTLGEVIAAHQKTQLRIAETEKFNHVTFYFSGERKSEFAGESRILVPSPKCASYAEKPEMSAREMTAAAISALQKTDFDFVVHNFANADLVGHSGDFAAAKKAVEVLDECAEKLIPFLQSKNYEILITADHGNADEMIDSSGSPNASHTKNLVPFCAVSDSIKNLRPRGTLADIAPTVLEVLGISQSAEMTGKGLIDG